MQGLKKEKINNQKIDFEFEQIFIPGGKGKFYFFQWSVTGYFNHTQGQIPCPGVTGQHKMNSMFSVFL